MQRGGGEEGLNLTLLIPFTAPSFVIHTSLCNF